MGSLKAAVLAVLIGIISAQDPDCDYATNVVPGRTYEIKNKEYPSSYRPGVQCRWIATCPSGYHCLLECPDINIPKTPGCTMDRLLVSRTGDPQLSAADYYCDQGTLSVESSGQRLSVGLITSYNSPGGRFYCRLTAKQASGSDTCSCGYRKQNRIVGGVETQVNEFPSMAGIADLSISQIKCGATIIAPNYLLSAAHCFDNLNENSIAVVVGEHNVSTGADTSATKAYRVSRILRHPQYNSNTYANDIAILTVPEAIQFGPYVGPACLPFKFTNYDFAGEQVIALGWGNLFIGGPSSSVLRKAVLDVISQSTCRNKVSSLTSAQICTFTPGKDACQDDSGGPLLYTDRSNGLLYSVGVISYGRSCASNEPGVNTRVSAYLQWILNNTPNANYCRK